MIPHRRLLEITRDTKSTLYIVAVFYVLIGFALATWGLSAGDRLGTFVGFVIISGALATTALLRAVLRMGIQLSSIHESLERIRTDLARTRGSSPAEVAAASTSPRESAIPGGASNHRADGASQRTSSLASTVASGDLKSSGGASTNLSQAQAHEVPAATPVRSTIDLAHAPMENADVLAAVTLERGVFPRLVRAMEADPPAQSASELSLVDDDSGAEMPIDALEWFDGPLAETASVRSAAAVRNILRSWRVALRERDLLTCRRVFAALEDTADASIVDPLRQPLADLIARVERDLRDEFARQRQAGDFPGMLQVGQSICALLPERPIAAEFRRIEPHILRRVQEDDASVPEEPEPARAAR